MPTAIYAATASRLAPLLGVPQDPGHNQARQLSYADLDPDALGQLASGAIGPACTVGLGLFTVVLAISTAARGRAARDRAARNQAASEKFRGWVDEFIALVETWDATTINVSLSLLDRRNEYAAVANYVLLTELQHRLHGGPHPTFDGFLTSRQ